ncbi:hypothetical protein REPUB_Repub05bG0183500 [Reevesia pubescens]
MSQLLIKLYLFAYNSVQAFRWTISLFRILTCFIAINSVNGAYASAGDLIFQFVTNLCILGSCTWSNRNCSKWRVVSSDAMKWNNTFLVQEFPAVFITFFAWSLTEVIRYSHYALNIFGNCPSWLTYMRYTSFIVLYPMGRAPGEMWLMYQALPFIKEKNLYGDFSAKLPFSYYNFVKVILLIYPFLWLKLYLHLFKQRRSKLGKHHEKKKR